MSTPWIAAFVLLALVVALVAFLVVGMLRRIALVLEQAESRLRQLPSDFGPGGLAVGAPIADFVAETEAGIPFTASDLRGGPALVVFLSSGCAPCLTLARDLERADAERLGARLFAVLHDPSERLELGLSSAVRVLYQRDGAISQAFETSATPHTFVLDSAGRVVATGTPNSFEGLKRLVTDAQGGDPNEGLRREVVEA